MIPFELEIYVSMIEKDIEEEKAERERQKNRG